MFEETALTIRRRYESKFVIPKEMIEPISRFASIYCSPDKHSSNTDNGFYCINNLHFDTPDYLFLIQRLDKCNRRLHLRIRSYPNSKKYRCFLEVKEKTGDIVNKYRAPLYDENWRRMFEDPDYSLCEEKDFDPNSSKTHFLKTAYFYNATPKMLSQYWRKAYVSNVNEYARVTFDADLRFQPAEGYCIIPDENKMVSLDDETLFAPECNVILELKCYTMQVPLWMIDLIRHFNLQRRGFSKYVAGIMNVLQLYKYDSGVRQASSVLF